MSTMITSELRHATFLTAISVSLISVAGQALTRPAREPFLMTDVIVSGLKIPSAIAFLPDGRALVAEREIGTIRLV
jgi:glucose/arabinose dehydrogenase